MDLGDERDGRHFKFQNKSKRLKVIYFVSVATIPLIWCLKCDRIDRVITLISDSIKRLSLFLQLFNQTTEVSALGSSKNDFTVWGEGAQGFIDQQD